MIQNNEFEFFLTSSPHTSYADPPVCHLAPLHLPTIRTRHFLREALRHRLNVRIVPHINVQFISITTSIAIYKAASHAQYSIKVRTSRILGVIKTGLVMNINHRNRLPRVALRSMHVHSEYANPRPVPAQGLVLVRFKWTLLNSWASSSNMYADPPAPCYADTRSWILPRLIACIPRYRRSAYYSTWTSRRLRIVVCDSRCLRAGFTYSGRDL
jgi:hypothetical protein